MKKKKLESVSTKSRTRDSHSLKQKNRALILQVLIYYLYSETQAFLV